MANINLAYAAASDVTITLASLASDTNLLAGRESAAIDNTSSLYLDMLLSGKITTGTSPTNSKSIEIWAIGSWDGTTWPDVFDGTDSAETISSADVKTTICRLIASIITDATSNNTYHFGPTSIASVFGGNLPPKIVLFVTHNTGVALNTTAGNHRIRLLPVYQTLSGSVPAYSLPTATNSTLGGVKIGSGVTITDGVISVNSSVTLTGDVTGSGTGSFATTLSNTGVSAGTYTSVTVDAKGRITAGSSPAVAYSSLSGVPSTFAPSVHKTSHAIGGSDALSPSDIGAAASSHTHSWSQIVSGLPTTLSGYGITDAQSQIIATGILKGAGSGSISAATAGTDYQAAITATGLLKGAGAGSVSAAVAGTDYLSPSSDIDGGSY